MPVDISDGIVGLAIGIVLGLRSFRNPAISPIVGLTTGLIAIITFIIIVRMLTREEKQIHEKLPT